MKIEIKNRYTGNIILCGEYKNIKDCLEKNSSVDLRYANLSYVDLRYANITKRYISINRIGSRKGQMTYCFEDDIIWSGLS